MATDLEQVVLSFSADLTALRRELQRSGQVVRGATDQMVGGLNGIGRAADGATARVQAMNDNVARTMKAGQLATKNLGYQINDIVSGLASGQKPLQVMNQQMSQITQSLAGLGGRAAAGAIFGALMDPLILIPAALSIASVAFTKFYKSADDQAAALAKDIGKLKSALDEFGSLTTTGNKDVLNQVVSEQKIAEAITGLEKIRDELRAVASVKLQGILSKLPPFEGLARQLGSVESIQIVQGLQDQWKALIVAVQKGEDPLEKVNTLIKSLEAIELAAPNSGAAGLAATLREQVIPNLEKAADREKAISALLAAIGTDAVEAAKRQAEAEKKAAQADEDYAKAMKELNDTAVPKLTEIQKIFEQHAIAIQNAKTALDAYNADLAQTNALTRLQTQEAGDLGASLKSDLDEYAKKIVQVEGGGSMDPLQGNKAGASSAFGPFQFTVGTFVDAVHMLPGFEAATRQDILAQKGNIELQKRAFEAFTEDNQRFLAAHHIEVTDATRYLVHFLGKGGALALLSADRNATAAGVVGAKATAANPTILGGGKSVQDVINWAARKMGAAGAKVDIKTQRESTTLSEKQAQATDDIGKGYDAIVAKQQEGAKYEELMANFRKDHADASKVETEEYEKQARIEAARFGKLKGEEAGTKTAEEAKKTYEGTLQALKDTNAELALEVQQNGAVNATIDEQKVARDANVLAMQKENDLKERGVTLSQANKDAILAEATAQLTYKAKLDAVKESTKASLEQQQELAQQINQLGKSAIGGFIQDLRSGVSVGDAFNNMLNRILDSLIDIGLNMIFGGGKSGGGGIGGWLASLITGVPAAAEGGIVGKTAFPRRFVDPRVFNGAPRMARGGMVGGLRSGEFPIIAHRGEMIVPKAMVGSSTRTPIGGDVTNNVGDITVDMSGTGMVASSTQSGKLLGRQIEAAVQVVMTKESRPGGILRRQGTS